VKHSSSHNLNGPVSLFIVQVITDAEVFFVYCAITQ